MKVKFFRIADENQESLDQKAQEINHFLAKVYVQKVTQSSQAIAIFYQDKDESDRAKDGY